MGNPSNNKGNPSLNKNRYLVDTSIWIDLYEDKKGYQGQPLGDFAWKLFAKIKSKKDIVVISELLIIELEMNYSIEEIRGMMEPFKDLIEKITITKHQRDEAKKIARERNIPKGDALHAILTRDNELILITRDTHFKKLEDISKHYKPEDFI
ncbi:MAG: PIN domain-containing protein [Nanoarchaeota archaeon]